MATWQRMLVVLMVSIGVAIAGIIHFRFGVDVVYPMATGQFSGPFTPAVSALQTLVPLTLAIIELSVIAWAISGGVQRERARIRRGR